MLKLKNDNNLLKIVVIASITIVTLVVFVLISDSSSVSNEKNNETAATIADVTSTTVITTEKKEIIRINAEQLVKEFENNPQKADKKYNNKILEISGAKVVNIDSSLIEFGYATDDPWYYSFGEIKCYFNKQQDKKVQSLKKDDVIKIVGEYNGLTGSDHIKLINTKFF